jgi:hypothetical protein
MSLRKVHLNRRISNKEFRTVEVKTLRNSIFLVRYSKFQIFLFRVPSSKHKVFNPELGIILRNSVHALHIQNSTYGFQSLDNPV